MTAGLVALALAAAPGWSFVVRPTLATGLVRVTATYAGCATTRVCADMPGSGHATTQLEQRVGKDWAPRPATTRDCFDVTPADPLELRYEVSLAALHDAHHDADFALRFDDAWVFNEEAVLLRPDPLAPDAELSLAFELEPGVSVAAPWQPVDATHFRSTAAQYDGGSYVAVGRLESLGTLDLGGASLSLHRLPGASKADGPTLERWLRAALDSLVAFYGEVPSGPAHRVNVLLAPIPGADDPGVFGQVLRKGTPSVLLMFGAEATGGFERDWVATHELFHLGNPLVRGRAPWLVEGFTTYFTDVLRARAGRLPLDDAWASLVEDCLDHGQPVGGRSLLEASHGMAESHSWDRVYRGGACLALRLDVALRLASKGRRSLDDVLRSLRLEPPRTEDELIAALDRASGGLASRHLHAKTPLPVDVLFQQLGVSRTSTGVRFTDTAPHAAVRRAITAAAPPPGR